MIIKKDKDTIGAYLEDSSNLKGGFAEEVVIPEDTAELSAFMRKANAGKTPVTIAGGGTGTTGSRVPLGGILLSMEKFDKIYDLSKDKMSAILQSGVLVDDLKKACEAKGLFYTSHPTEKTAFVGGTIATNASGARSFKYGPTRKYVKWLKMVLADGEEFVLRRGERFLKRGSSEIRLDSGRTIDVPIPAYRMPNTKNSAGYFAGDGMDLIDLFIGQEGTLSVITDVELGLEQKPLGILSAFVFFDREEDAWNFSGEARAISRLGPKKGGSNLEALSIEYFDSKCVELVRSKNKNVPASAKAAIFFEQEVSNLNQDAILDEWLKLISKYGVPLDNTWVAMNEADAAKFIEIRHSIPEAMNDIIRRRGIEKLATDIAVPDDKFPEMARYYAEVLKEGGVEYYIFGHIGECHLHVNLLPKSEAESVMAREIYVKFVRKATAFGGTISAEHGIGKIKRRYLEMMYGKSGIMEMARIKKAFDPNCILGLGNIFSKELLREV